MALPKKKKNQGEDERKIYICLHNNELNFSRSKAENCMINKLISKQRQQINNNLVKIQ
jgi:hypothetical protein